MNEEHKEKRIFPFKMSEKLPIGKQPKAGLFEKVKSLFFKRQDVSELSLVGRIHTQLKRDAHVIVEQLKAVKETFRKELEGHNDNQLWLSFEAVINPLLREYEHIEKKLTVHEGDTLEEKTSAIKSYNEWVEKATLWVTLSARLYDRASIIQAVIFHSMQVLDMIIDRDLKTLREYLMHELNSLNLDHYEIAKIAKKIEKELQVHVQALIQLKSDKPYELQIEQLPGWKRRIDESRTKHYEGALQIIETVIDAHAPHQETHEEHEFFQEFFTTIARLEEEVPLFLAEAAKMDPDDQELKNILLKQHVILIQQVQELNENLRLTPELEERVQNLLNELEESKRLF